MTGLLHALNPANWHWHHGEGYLVGGSATASLFGALTADQVTAWGGAIVAVVVAVVSAYKGQRRSQGALDAINKANLAAIRQHKAVPFPDYLPPAK